MRGCARSATSATDTDRLIWRSGRSFALGAASLLCSVLVCEVGLRVVDVYRPPPPVPVPRRPDLYRADAELGYTLWPSTRTMYRYPVSSSRVLALVSNANGFRSPRELDEPDPRTRIWVLGDSMVLGDGVAAEDRLTEVMERLEPGWRVDNLGMTGWGVDLMVRAVERVSRRVRPDVVVLAVYTDDFRRLQPSYAGMGYLYPKFDLAGDRLVTVPFPSLPRWRRLRLVQAVEQFYWQRALNRFDLHATLLERLRAAKQGFALAVVFLPGRSDTPEDRRRRTWLRDWCEDARTPFVDLTEPIHGAGVDSVYLQDNPHWNERGHRVAGEAIHRFLRETVLSR